MNLQGELIGINTAIISPSGGNAGIAFAIPSNQANNLVQQILEFGEVRRGLLGIKGGELNADLAKAFNVSAQQGAFVSEVIPHSAAEKAGFEHFMMKEIHEQPKAVLDTLNSVLKDGKIDLSEVGLEEESIRNIQQIYIIACGSAYHVGMAAQYVIEDLAQIPVRVSTAAPNIFLPFICDLLHAFFIVFASLFYKFINIFTVYQLGLGKHYGDFCINCVRFS